MKSSWHASRDFIFGSTSLWSFGFISEWRACKVQQVRKPRENAIFPESRRGFLPRKLFLPPNRETGRCIDFDQYLREGDDASLLAEVELAGVEEVEHAVEVPGLPEELVLVELGIEAVAEVEDLGVGLALAQLAEARLGKTLEQGPRGLRGKRPKLYHKGGARPVSQFR